MSDLADLLQHPDFWKLASIPVIAGLVGWSTNWVAIQMTFRPVDFVGIPPYLGWQGIIPAKAKKMATIFVDTTMARLGRLSEVFARMEPEVLAEQIAKVMEPRLEDYTDEVVLQTQGALWKRLPLGIRGQVYDAVRREMPGLITDLLAEIGERVEELMDLKAMIVGQLEHDRSLLNRLFLEAGAAEFRFIVRSGLYFGFLFGLVQLAVWAFYRGWWVLPVFGLLVGWATNWIALNVIFRPLYPKKVGPFTFQGLFLKRQQEVAGAWCHLVTREIITVDNIAHALLYGPRSARTRELIRARLEPVVDRAVEPLQPLARWAVSDRGLESLRLSVGEKAIFVSQDAFADPVFVEERAEIIERVIRERMESLPPDQFQDLLRPCFQEDELKLILVGAALGLAAGIGQLVFVFGV